MGQTVLILGGGVGGLVAANELRKALPNEDRVVRGEIERIDPVKREAWLDGRALPGDYLIIALGAELAPESIPGLVQAGHNFYTLAGAEGFRDAFAQFTGGT